MRKLIFLFLIFFSVNCYAEDQLLKVRIDDFSGGQNSFDLSDVISPNQGTSFINIILNKKGVLSKRMGQTLFANDISDTAFTGLGTFYPSATVSYILAASGPSIIRSDTVGANWTTINGSNPLSSGKDTEFVQANNLLFILNGSNQTPLYDGTTWTVSGGTTASPPTATTGAWIRNYFFCAGNPAHPDWLYFSNNLSPAVFTPTDIIPVNTGDGQKIINIETFKLNELIVYKERSIFNLDLTGSTPLTDWTLQNVSSTIGCIAPRSVVNVGNDHIFLSSDPIAVRTLVRTSYDKITIDRLSTPIQDIFDGTGDTAINKTYISKACAVLFDDKYILAIPTGSSTLNNLVCVYDFVTKSWYLINGWYPAEWVVFNNNLYCINAQDGMIQQCFTGTTGDVTPGPTVITNAASSATVGISYTYTSKNIDFDNPENFKQLDALDMEFGTSGNYNATVYIELDDGGFQDIGSINLAGNAPVLPINLPFNLGAGGVARKTFQLQQYGEFKKIKIKIVQSGLSQECYLHSFTLFATLKKWRREN